ncbi:hypothetical protein K7432_014766 [Basidiobolus ranarum]|uniref:FAD-binding domain-containing protein n=1 Tax=Basidiobolus ranarum TaxID=34480 RepID=A0ABR2WH39_9FUNG
MSKHIIIIGSGLGGLCLAQGLKKNKIPFVIYERDASSSARSQGYRIRINNDGAHALRATLPENLWQVFEASCAMTHPGMTGLNPLTGANTPGRGPSLVPNVKDQLGPYTADRSILRQVLLIGIEDDVHFNKEFTSAEYLSEDKIVAHFSDGSTSIEGALLVGADDIRSGVRRQYLPDHIPLDTRGRCIYGKTPITPQLEKIFPIQAQNGIVLIKDNSCTDMTLALFLESIRFPSDWSHVGSIPRTPDYYYWVMVSHQEMFGLADHDLLHLSPAQCADLSLQLTKTWNPAICSLLELQDRSQACTLRIVSSAAQITPWTLSAPVTFLGDAIHCMSPASGMGANTAFMDGRELCQAIVREGLSPKAVEEYEAAMRVYAKTNIKGGAKGGKNIFSQKPLEESEPVAIRLVKNELVRIGILIHRGNANVGWIV